MTAIDDARAERDQVRAAALAMAESDDFDPNDKTFLDLQTRADAADKKVATLVEIKEKQSTADAFDGRLAKIVQRQDRAAADQAQTRESWGQQFVRSDVFSNYSHSGTSSRFMVEDLQTRALPTGVADLVAAGFKGAVLQVDTTAPTAPTPLLDVMTTVNVSTNALEYVAWSKKAGSAAIVAEKAAKPSAEYGPTVTPATLDMIAVYTQLTRQLIEDFAAVQSLIDGELRREVLREEEEQAAATLVAATLPTATGADLLKAIRVGIGTVQAAGYQPNAVLLNPADWAALDIVVFGATLGGATIGQSFWGLTPIAAASQPAGTATVGDYRAGVQHFVRSGVNLYITDSHASTFLENVFTLLAERRAKTAVTRPAALCECTATP